MRCVDSVGSTLEIGGIGGGIAGSGEAQEVIVTGIRPTHFVTAGISLRDLTLPQVSQCTGAQEGAVHLGQAIANGGSTTIGFSEKTGLLSIGVLAAGVSGGNTPLAATGVVGTAASAAGIDLGSDAVVLGHLVQFIAAPSPASAINFIRGVINDAVVKPLPVSTLTKQMISDAIDRAQPPEQTVFGN